MSFTYDAWGKVYTTENITNASLLQIARETPFRYRGYFYDNETGYYYLNTRYYNPQIKRFISADSVNYLGANGDLNSYNLYAYCSNNPVMYVDPNGESAILAGIILTVVIIAAAVLLSGCGKSENAPREDLVNASDLDINTASPDTYNCYGNAIGKQIVANPTGYVKGDNVEKTFAAVCNDLGKDNVRRLNSIDDQIEDDEYKVTMMCAPNDYHFIRLYDDGWYNKSGTTNGLYVDQSIVEASVWYPMFEYNGQYYVNYQTQYTDGPIYFAVKKRWAE